MGIAQVRSEPAPVVQFLVGGEDESPLERALADLTGYVYGMMGHIPQARGEPLEHFVGMLVFTETPEGLKLDAPRSGYHRRATVVPALEGAGDELGREMVTILRSHPSPGFFHVIVDAPGVRLHVRSLKVLPFAGAA